MPVTCRPGPQSQKATYATVVHGSRKKPRNGTIQLSNARLRTLLVSHSRMMTSRGEMRARSARKQPMVVLPLCVLAHAAARVVGTPAEARRVRIGVEGG